MTEHDPVKVYTASRTRHAAKWRAMREAGVTVVSTWIDEAGPGESTSVSDLWTRCVREARDADVLLLYVEDGDLPIKGALVEVGAALAAGKPVCVVGNLVPGNSWMAHPSVTECESVEMFVAGLASVVPGKEAAGG